MRMNDSPTFRFEHARINRLKAGRCDAAHRFVRGNSKAYSRSRSQAVLPGRQPFPPSHL